MPMRSPGPRCCAALGCIRHMQLSVRNHRSDRMHLVLSIVEATCCAVFCTVGSALLIRMEDEVLRLHLHMTLMPAVRGRGVGRHRAVRYIMVEQGVSPP